MNFEEELKDRTAHMEEVLDAFWPKEEGLQRTVIEAMNYSVMAGGKRLRPMLMEETYKMFGGSGELIEPFMAAIEMIHNYSLVHDDLPAMDNDEYRRGRKTTHIVYGEGMAVLAGDALLNYAFETACLAFDKAKTYEEYQRTAAALKVLGKKAGIYGMIGGQCVDIESEDKQTDLTEELILFIHEHKTAALIQSAMMIGAILAEADDEQVKAVEKCAYNIGIAFQIQDDILDVTSSTEVLGKPVGSDEKNNKITYVTIHGIEQSKEKTAELSAEAIHILASFPQRNLFLEELVKELIYRKK
ncbi:MAG: polyprenyl synthetase family protein [Butyrivibrio sp.]|nr:polyprenyl synthetase family protein [Butyrivibrio sp.]